MLGLRIAALYGIKPHQLGLCGPREAAEKGLLEKFLTNQASKEVVEAALKQFKGAMAYYQLIAKCNGIKYPFAEEVVRAYWIGNELLESIKTEDLRKMIKNDFSGKGLFDKKIATEKAKRIPEGAKPHHSFHVFFIGSVTGTTDLSSTAMKDLCRIGWGKVIKLQSGKIVVKTQPLTGERKIKLGKPVEKTINWTKELLPNVKIGSWVSYHWNQAVEVLTTQEVANLKKYTLKTLALLP